MARRLAGGKAKATSKARTVTAKGAVKRKKGMPELGLSQSYLKNQVHAACA